jgi:hypothetical protein
VKKQRRQGGTHLVDKETETLQVQGLVSMAHSCWRRAKNQAPDSAVSCRAFSFLHCSFCEVCVYGGGGGDLEVLTLKHFVEVLFLA